MSFVNKAPDVKLLKQSDGNFLSSILKNIESTKVTQLNSLAPNDTEDSIIVLLRRKADVKTTSHCNRETGF